VYCRFLLILLAALFTAACSSKKDVTPTRYAVLRLENLTPDPTLNWIGRAASEVLIQEIGAIPSNSIFLANEHYGGRPVASPGVSTELTDAILAGANHIVTGYFELLDNGALNFHLVEEDTRTGKRLRSLSAQGSVLDACTYLAKQLTATAKPFSTSSNSALRAYIQGIEGGSSSASGYQSAIAADPQFKEAYLALGEQALAHHDADTVDRVFAEAKAHNLDAGVTAKLQLASATIHNDNNARTAALEKIIETEPANFSAIQALGELQMATHRFAEAAATFGKAQSDMKPEMVNLMAYALMFSGDEKGAMEAIRKFRTLRSQDPNAVDSEGDVNYYFGHFAEAEKRYLASATMNPQFNQGMETWKAARARLMTGDIVGASQIFDRYRAEREKANDISMPYRIASWQFLTGDRAGGLAAMRQVAASSPIPTIKSLAFAQVAIWEMQLGRKADALKDAQESMQKDGGAAVIPAVVVRFAAMDLAPLAELRARAEKMFGGTAGAQVRLLAVGYTLYFASRNSEAVGIWKEIYEQSDPADPVIRGLYGTLLLRTGHQDEGAALLKNTPPPPTALTPSFESLYFKPGSTAAPTK
jgi:Flp pilus assembly protein TadD